MMMPDTKIRKGTAIFRNIAPNRGLITIFSGSGPKPLQNWHQKIQNGYIQQYVDTDIRAMVIKIGGTNVSTTYITCPKNTNDSMGIHLPFFIMVVKNLKKYFTFEVTILDETGFKRRFRAANFQSTTRIMEFSTVMPIGLGDGWNQIQFNLSDFCQRAYKTNYSEVVRVQINANIVLRRIYFAQRLVPDDELPEEYKLYTSVPIKSKSKPIADGKDNRDETNYVPSPPESKVNYMPSPADSKVKQIEENIVKGLSRSSLQRISVEHAGPTSTIKLSKETSKQSQQNSIGSRKLSNKEEHGSQRSVEGIDKMPSSKSINRQFSVERESINNVSSIPANDNRITSIVSIIKTVIDEEVTSNDDNDDKHVTEEATADDTTSPVPESVLAATSGQMPEDNQRDEPTD